VTTLLAFIVVIGILIFVHELGHFMAAKALGVQVLRFSLGFGRPLLAWRRGETEYWLSWIPVGGYVKMAGLEDEGLAEVEGKSETPIDPARAFDQRPVWVRLVVLLAGVTMNMLLALAVYVGIETVAGSPELAVGRVDSVATAALPAGAAALGELRPGDSLVAVNDSAVRSWDDLRRLMRAGPADLSLTVAGRPEPLRLHLASKDEKDSAFRALSPRVPARLGVVQPGFPAYRGGIRAGDVVVRIAGDTVLSWTQFLHLVRSSPGRALPMDVVRQGEATARHVVVVPDTQFDAGADTAGAAGRTAYGYIGALANVPTRYVRVPFVQGVGEGARQTVRQTGAILSGLALLATGRAHVRDLGGPIMIGQLSGQAAKLGIVDWLLPMLALFSINLALLNLLPIPVLDGGQVMFVLAEAVRRRPLSLQLRLRLSQAGLFVIICLMLFVIGNDLLRNFIH
jgi:regulator of sigma E protease